LRLNFSIEFVLTNSGYDADVVVDFCGMTVVDKGENLACLNVPDDVTETRRNNKTVDE